MHPQRGRDCAAAVLQLGEINSKRNNNNFRIFFTGNDGALVRPRQIWQFSKKKFNFFFFFFFFNSKNILCCVTPAALRSSPFQGPNFS